MIFDGKRFGLGGVPFGNEFAYVTDEEAHATIEAAWNAGVRYFDTSPWYGLGLAERRLGSFLHKQTRGEYTLSSKVGKSASPAPLSALLVKAAIWFATSTGIASNNPGNAGGAIIDTAG